MLEVWDVQRPLLLVSFAPLAGLYKASPPAPPPHHHPLLESIYIYSDYIGTYSKNQLSKIESDQPQKNYPNTGPAIRALYRVPLWRTAEELHETPPVDKLITSTSINLAASS